MPPFASPTPAPRVPCKACGGSGRSAPPAWLVGLAEEAGQPTSEIPHAPCPQCQGAGGWQERALDWEPIEGRCAVSPEGMVTVRPDSVTERLPVPGGWLVRSVRYHAVNDGGGVGVGLAFVPDPRGEWNPVAPLAPGSEEG